MTALEKIVQSVQLGDRTREIYKHAIEGFIEFAGESPTNWTPDMVRAWHSKLRNRYSPSTRQIHVIALKLVSRVYARNYHQPDFAAELKLPRVRRAAPQVLDPKSLKKLLKACSGDDPHSLRDRALILLLACNLSRAEVVKIQVDDVSGRGDKIAVKGRELALDEETSNAVLAWRKWLFNNGHLRGGLFPRLAKSSAVIMNPLSPNGVYVIIQRRAEEAGVEGASPRSITSSAQP